MYIYDRLFERGLTKSRRHFSERWLGRAQNYDASNRSYTLDTYYSLYGNLKEAGQLDLAEAVIAIVFDLPHPTITGGGR